MNYPSSTLVTSNGDELTELARREAVDVVDQVYGYHRIGESGNTQRAFSPIEELSGTQVWLNHGADDHTPGGLLRLVFD